jgi:antitoxin ParD1/3/4
MARCATSIDEASAILEWRVRQLGALASTRALSPTRGAQTREKLQLVVGKACHERYAALGMPTRNVSLTREQDAFIAEVVEAGEYQNASEAVRDAVRALQQRRREDALRLDTLRSALEAGLRELDGGAFVEVESADLDRYLAGLTRAAPRSRTAEAARSSRPAPRRAAHERTRRDR